MTSSFRKLKNAAFATLVFSAAAAALSPAAALAQRAGPPTVRPGHDVIVEQPGNRTVHVWCGNKGEIFISCRDNNKGASQVFVVERGIPRPLPPPPPPPPRPSTASLYNPETNTTTTRTWNPGGPTTTIVEQGNTLANH